MTGAVVSLPLEKVPLLDWALLPLESVLVTRK